MRDLESGCRLVKRKNASQHEPGCYYTPKLVSELLAKQFQNRQAAQIVDIGAGHGALLAPVQQRYPHAALHAIEPHGQASAFLKKRFPGINSQRLNGLDLHLKSAFGLSIESMDIVVSNPPYLRVKNSTQYDSLFVDAGLSSCIRLSILSADLVFLAQGLRLLKKHGELGIIVPDGLLTNQSFQCLREDLVAQHKICNVIQLPDRIFPHTEARSHILIIRKGGITSKTVKLYCADRDGVMTEAIQIHRSDLIKRMDFQYWSWQRNSALSLSLLGKTLAQLGAEIKRGRLTKNDYAYQGLTCFHTSDFNRYGQFLALPETPETVEGLLAEAGDILLSRVGKRCIGLIGLVTQGRLPVTDSIYRIRVTKPYQMQIFQALNSQTGQQWLKHHAHGVCAQVISKADLMEFQI